MPTPTMQRLAQWPLAHRRAVVGVLTDIDDTLTAHGQIEPVALQALHTLAEAGLWAVGVTGRPLAFGAQCAQQWPLHAVVCENGAAAWLPPTALRAGGLSQNGLQRLIYERRALQKRYQDTAEDRQRQRQQLDAGVAAVASAVPHARLADDSSGRETDIAFDHAEHTRLSPANRAAVVAALQSAGLRTLVSSIHVHGFAHRHDKFSGAAWALREMANVDLHDPQARLGWVAVGDSANDEALFAHLPHSVGVANIHAALPHMAHHPRYVTPAERGAGFAQLVQALLDARA
jgi:HAD superfamily hydrolase (TIGR01484 family)